MKELSIKEKAKAYDEAIERAKDMLSYKEVRREDMEYLFPELKESEDERIRKELISHFCGIRDNCGKDWYGYNINDIIAWLEKQDPEYKAKAIRKVFGNKAKDTVEETQEKKQESIDYKEVKLDKSKLKPCPNPYWTLAPEYNLMKEQKLIDKIQLGKKYKCIASPRYSTFMTGKIYKPEDKFLCSLMNFCSDCFEPVEDGEQKPAWSEEVQEEQVNEEFINALGAMLNDGLPDRYLVSEERIKKSAELLFSIARKQLKNEMQEWGEEDEKLYYDLSDTYFYNDEDYPEETYKLMLKRVLDWMTKRAKFLKHRYTWKPSDEQIMALRWVLNHIPYDSHKEEISGLLEQLKKLMEK